MKVAFFITSLNSGGAENYLLRFLQLYAQYFEVHIYCKSNQFGELETKYRELNVYLHKISLRYISIIDFLNLHKEIKKKKFDAVLDFTGDFGGIVILASFIARVKKRIILYRGSYNFIKNDTLLKKSYIYISRKLNIKYATDVLSNSYYALDYFFQEKASKKPKFKVIYNGIDLETFSSNQKNLYLDLKIKETDFVIGHVGRFHPAKNHKAVLIVAIELCKKYQNLKFIICGKGVPQGLCDYIYSTGLEKQILLLDYYSEIIEVYNTIDFFYFPSISEGQPNALIEALILGKPFVASNIPTIKETVPKPYANYLVDPFDYNTSIRILSQYIEGNSFNSEELKRLITKKFDAKTQFELFYKTIIK